MSKPAPKEPSMDEILSSIRQIIADDDAGAVTRPPAAPPIVPRSFAPVPPRPVEPAPQPEPEPEPEPLALSAEQILRDTAAEDQGRPGLSFNELIGEPALPNTDLELVDPDDISFEAEEVEEPAAPVPAAPTVQAAPRLPPVQVPERPGPRPATSVAQAAPLPDPTLTRDLAEQLLEPATQSAVQSTFGRLSGLTAVGSGVTIEQMMREMLRPMLKEWLDENLPSIVERMVEQEIARVSRGGR